MDGSKYCFLHGEIPCSPDCSRASTVPLIHMTSELVMACMHAVVKNRAVWMVLNIVFCMG